MEYSIKINKDMNSYSNDIKRLIIDISREIEKDVKDGIAGILSSSKKNEVELYEFIKDQGYAITYKDYQEFYEDCKEMIEINLDEVEKMIKNEEASTEELSDDQLEIVSGGGLKSFWKKHKKEILIGGAIVAALAITAVIVVATCGVGAAAVGTAAVTVGSEVALPVAAGTSVASAAKIAWLTGSALILL